MKKLIMLIGIPGCGKSTLSKELESQGFVIHSSDAIRNELDMHSADDTAKVFDILHKRVLADMQLNKDIIYDATNLSRKNRVSFLKMIKRYNYTKIAYMFITPIEVCMERNAKRTGYARVPDYVYSRMLKSYNAPTYKEGWDEIKPILYTEKFDIPINLEDLDTFEQDNPHHKHTLGEHQKMTTAYLEKRNADNLLITASMYHDIGKVFTKTFTNMRGEVTEVAHYYGHDNYGTYVFLLVWLWYNNNGTAKLSWEDALYVAQIINWHMALYRWVSEKSLNKDRDLYIDTDLYNKVIEFNKADLNAK